MNQKIQKVLLSTALVAGFGAVAVSAPFSASAAPVEKLSHKDKEERIANNAAFLEAQAAQFQAMFGTPATEPTKTEEAAAPKETTATEQTQANKQITVVVPQGASLTELAAQYGVTVDELVAANNLLPVGFQLTVPQK
ncbi:LysM peptidoglycan-binding domain-containing protein [Paenibacillus campi]|uniref:LysM peptidoglycan-binding domain-containing protein n=1 Tax=Paenibacillus campi TaxID=3106031 RepID=UPI002AFEE914|nr:LysM peptidoglycan-binding domain-containing protein [Paenibacillus sp. SGZ-1014]